MLFSALPTNLGNRENRFPHSHRHDYDEKHVRKSPQRSLLKLPASNPPFRLISGLEKTRLECGRRLLKNWIYWPILLLASLTES
jgi:hypothetical protein